MEHRLFSSWSATGATIQDGGPSGGYDSAAIVFTSSGAVVKAKLQFYYRSIQRYSGLDHIQRSKFTYSQLRCNAHTQLRNRTTVSIRWSFCRERRLIRKRYNIYSIFLQWLDRNIVEHDGSSITNSKISYASSPLTITNVNTATISLDTLNNSTFGNQAISVINSSPTITSVQIIGQSGSSNGVRYTTGKGARSRKRQSKILELAMGLLFREIPIPLFQSHYFKLPD